MYLPRSQTSLSRWKFALKGRREGERVACLLSPSRGPSRFVTSHSRFALAFVRDQSAKRSA